MCNPGYTYTFALPHNTCRPAPVTKHAPITTTNGNAPTATATTHGCVTDDPCRPKCNIAGANAGCRGDAEALARIERCPGKDDRNCSCSGDCVDGSNPNPGLNCCTDFIKGGCTKEPVTLCTNTTATTTTITTTNTTGATGTPAGKGKGQTTSATSAAKATTRTGPSTGPTTAPPKPPSPPLTPPPPPPPPGTPGTPTTTTSPAGPRVAFTSSTPTLALVVAGAVLAACCLGWAAVFKRTRTKSHTQPYFALLDAARQRGETAGKDDPVIDRDAPLTGLGPPLTDLSAALTFDPDLLMMPDGMVPFEAINGAFGMGEAKDTDADTDTSLAPFGADAGRASAGHASADHASADQGSDHEPFSVPTTESDPISTEPGETRSTTRTRRVSGSSQSLGTGMGNRVTGNRGMVTHQIYEDIDADAGAINRGAINRDNTARGGPQRVPLPLPRLLPHLAVPDAADPQALRNDPQAIPLPIPGPVHARITAPLTVPVAIHGGGAQDMRGSRATMDAVVDDGDASTSAVSLVSLVGAGAYVRGASNMDCVTDSGSIATIYDRLSAHAPVTRNHAPLASRRAPITEALPGPAHVTAGPHVTAGTANPYWASTDSAVSTASTASTHAAHSADTPLLQHANPYVAYALARQSHIIIIRSFF